MKNDIIIIGAGPGGFDTAIYAAKHGLKTLLIEKEEVGGTCLNWGCVPTKALYQNAKMVETMKKSATFGINQKGFDLDFDQIKARKETIVSNQVEGIYQTLKASQVDLIKGEAQLVDEHTVKVNDELFKAKHIILATGSKSKKLRFNGDDLPIIHTSKSILTLKTFPKKLLVVGAGVIGSEMAMIFKSLGSEVTLIDFQDEILMTEDKDIRKRARNLFKRAGLKIHTNASLVEVKNVDDTYFATFSTKKGQETIEVDHVLISVGRTFNASGIDLSQFDHSKDGIIVNASKQTSIDNIYAIGDLNGELMLAHKATYDGIRAVNHIIDKKDAIRFDLVPSVIFTHPLIASVGVKEDGMARYKTVKAYYKANAKAQAMDETDGFIKLIVDEDDVIKGAHIIGEGADYMIHELSLLLHQSIKVSEAFDMIHAHPTVSEIIHDALKEI
ncbi:MAG: dihydrolipoyl dehydrogenase [Candidatus Izemoplasmataceae bacterium]